MNLYLSLHLAAMKGFLILGLLAAVWAFSCLLHLIGEALFEAFERRDRDMQMPTMPPAMDPERPTEDSSCGSE